ncbi:MAG: DUF362 domain-containing protein [Patescibacteria group bacterium]
MSEVYFSPDLNTIIEHLDYSQLGQRVGIKIHFGEKGCNTFLNPEIARAVYNKLKSLGKKPTLVECNVLYKGSRTNSTDHIQTAREHGFTDMEIDILDGENGNDYLEINGCKIGKGIEKYDSIIVLTHLKGHEMAGFGGSIKNVGMGFGSRAGKLDMHSGVNPYVNTERCVGCGICAAHCQVDAIKITDGKATIDPATCEGCAMCIAICSTKAVLIPWEGRSSQELQKRIVDYTTAVINQFPNLLFINVLQNITAECDCMDMAQKPMMPDLGFLSSSDIVAIDQASLDLVNKYSDHKFDDLNSIDNYKQIELAKNLNLGDDEYDLIEL